MAEGLRVATFYELTDILIHKATGRLRDEDEMRNDVAEIIVKYERALADIEREKASTPLGTLEYLRLCQAAFELEIQKVKALQEIGFLPPASTPSEKDN